MLLTASQVQLALEYPKDLFDFLPQTVKCLYHCPFQHYAIPEEKMFSVPDHSDLDAVFQKSFRLPVSSGNHLLELNALHCTGILVSCHENPAVVGQSFEDIILRSRLNP